MAKTHGAHQRQANQQGTYQQPQYEQGGVQQQASGYQAAEQPTAKPQSAQQAAYEQAYREYVGDDTASQYAQRQAVYQEALRQRSAGGQAYANYAASEPAAGAYAQSGRAAHSSQASRAVQPQIDQGNYQRRVKPTSKKKGHPVRNTILVLLVILIIVGGAAGFTGYTLLQSAKQVKADASVVMTDISALKDQVLAEQPEQANATASDIVKHAQNMKSETSGWAWTVASYVPVYGSDISTVCELSNVLGDLAENAIVPIVSEASQVSVKNLFHDGAVNIEQANRLITALNGAAPVIERADAKLQAMGESHFDQINGPLEKAKTQIEDLSTVTGFVSSIAPTFTDMCGANGRRTYLVVAQGNTEIRSTGGFLGAIGPLYIENGQISMGDFGSISEIYPPENNGAPLTDEEVAIFGPHVGWQVGDASFIPDFSRVGQIVKYAWELKGKGTVDGVIGVDPVFLQDMLALTGPVTTSSGLTVDGTNAARILLRDTYYIYEENTDQDAVFQEVAALAFDQITSNIGNISLTQLASVLGNDIETRRFQAWMVAGNEEEALAIVGCDGKLSHDEEKPVLGVYFDDESYAKMCWYLNVDITTGTGTKNADGSMTYPVTVRYENMITDVDGLPGYMRAHNSLARSPGEMIEWVMLSAPEGGSVSDIQLLEGEYVPEGTVYRTGGSEVSGTMSHATLQGLDFWYGLSRTMPGNSFAISFNVITSPKATEPLKVVCTPNAKEAAGW